MKSVINPLARGKSKMFLELLLMAVLSPAVAVADPNIQLDMSVAKEIVIEENGQEILPKDEENPRCQDPQGTVHTCALAGDLRVNEQPTLGSMHALFIKEHNRIARRLKELNPNWNDEKLYQESKRIVNAEWQHIIYNEWLPQLIGVDLVKKFGLLPLTGKDFSYDYL